MSETRAAAPILALAGIGKSFSGIEVLRDVRLNLYPGEIHALMGQNGAGKSTLIKVLTGVFPADAGDMRSRRARRWKRSDRASAPSTRRSTSAPT